MPDKKYKLLITDDHPIFRNGLKNILKRTGLFSEIMEASNGIEAMKTVAENQVDLILMDVDMPDMNGVETTQKIMALHPEMNIVALTMFCKPRMVYDLCKSGIKGYLLKDTEPDEMKKALHMILQGEEYYSAKVQRVLAQALREYDSKAGRGKSSEITETQKQVLIHLCNQKSTDEIADLMHISPHTVTRHRQELLERTGSVNLAGLVLYALENGIISMSSKPDL
jgi:DNA-binding NarL/FixJ family response regulator